ncbi:SUKH-4 family immunity protein [Achromobacter xylosoxidans]|uniref:SUKH-4 family immunity protein n=1 Tax=Alcaligenes xylosoxydans xylosoxydans TaxID=85698 RepID=UPI001F13EFBE|nr:SUKH-4 family immunity protein [Achromobacter xylosoxidans]
MTADDLSGLYGGGAIRLDAATLDAAGLDSRTRAWLAEHGLPLRPDPAIPLVEFVPPRVRAGSGGSALVIAREPWTEALWLGLQADGRVVTAGQDEPSVFINSHIAHFLHFLAALQRFQSAAGIADTGPRVYTQAEMQARLDAFRKGLDRPSPRQVPRSAAQPFDRPAALCRLEQTWRDHDPDALARGAWWTRVLEQLRDGLL